MLSRLAVAMGMLAAVELSGLAARTVPLKRWMVVAPVAASLPECSENPRSSSCQR